MILITCNKREAGIKMIKFVFILKVFSIILAISIVFISLILLISKNGYNIDKYILRRKFSSRFLNYFAYFLSVLTIFALIMKYVIVCFSLILLPLIIESILDSRENELENMPPNYKKYGHLTIIK